MTTMRTGGGGAFCTALATVVEFTISRLCMAVLKNEVGVVSVNQDNEERDVLTLQRFTVDRPVVRVPEA